MIYVFFVIINVQKEVINMEYRLPKTEDKEMIEEYIADHYSHNETSLSASNMLTSMKWEDWV